MGGDSIEPSKISLKDFVEKLSYCIPSPSILKQFNNFVEKTINSLNI